MKALKIFLEFPNAALDQTFDYLAGPFDVQKGVRVKVPLRTGSAVGFVDEVYEIDDLEAYEKETGFKLKQIEEVIDEEPLLNEELTELGKWLAKETVTPVIACYKTMLPKTLKPQTRRKNVRMEAFYHYLKTPEGLTAKQAAMLEEIRKEDQPRPVMNSASPSICKKLLELGAIEVVLREKEAEDEQPGEAGKPLPLTEGQKAVKDEIAAGKEEEIFLLRGVTGSGKTEVYLQLAQDYLDAGRQVLILVPEISLTPQMTARVKARFASRVAIYHSGLNEQEKYEQYRLVQKHKVKIVVGTRSAVFMPFDDLGLIVLDEEHDGSYKQDSAPRYHCRDVALKRAQSHHAKVVLGSATPTLESYARALKGVYHLVELPKRVSGSLAKTHLVDMTRELRSGNNGILSRELVRRMGEVLSQNEQVILLLNRRGYATVVRCKECGHVVHCPHCDIPMCWHKEDHTLKCHICGYSSPMVGECPKCGAQTFRSYGYGTERLEEEVRRHFPEASVARLDADIAARKGEHRRIIEAFSRREYDILVGTQMISKGLDFPEVTLVGILNADALLNRMDYRAVELTFDLLVQASGRSGRGEKGGDVVMQVYDPSHYGIRLAAAQNYVGFFNQEMRYRRIGKYPPYMYFISLIAQDEDDDKAWKEIDKIRLWLREQGETDLLGPSELMKHHDLCRYRLLYRGKDLEKMKGIIQQLYQLRRKERERVSVVIDINPVGLEE